MYNADDGGNRSPSLPERGDSAMSESVDFWPLAIIILRRNRGHALVSNRPSGDVKGER